MPSVVEYESRKDEEVVEASGEFLNKAVKEEEIPQKVNPTIPSNIGEED